MAAERTPSSGRQPLVRRIRNAGPVAAFLEGLWRRSAVGANVHHGSNLRVLPGARLWAPTRLELGNDVYVGRDSTVMVDGSIGDGVMIADAVGIIGRTDHDHRQVGSMIRHSTWVGDDPARLSTSVTIGWDVWVGYGAIILGGVTVGPMSVVAAGAVVTEDVPANAIVAGNPARVVGQRFEDPAEHARILGRTL